MNTIRKPVERTLCMECGDVYEHTPAGDIRLAVPRQPQINPITGNPLKGVCPKHPRRRSVAE